MPLNIEKIRKLMGEKSVASVAGIAGMKAPNLFRVLSGKFDPKLSTIERLADALGVKVKDILL